MAQRSSSTTMMPDAAPDYDRAASTPLPLVNRPFLAEYYRTGLYSDLEVVSSNFVRGVHKIIVCSESPVIKSVCAFLEPGQPLRLNKFDPETLGRVLDFCYRHTYSDGEFPEVLMPSLLSMTGDDVRDALDTPLAVASDETSLVWRGRCTQCEVSAEEEDEGEIQEEDQDEYRPDRCEIDYSSGDESDSPDSDSESSDDTMPPVGAPPQSKSKKEPLKPPYAISLFANLKVYIAAKELQISTLELLARERFAHTLRVHWARFDDFPALIEQVYLRTQPSDHLRALICQIVAAGYANEKEMVFKAELREAMANNGVFALDVLDTVLRQRVEWADVA